MQTLFNRLARPIETMNAFVLQATIRQQSGDMEGAALDASKVLYLGLTVAAPIVASAAVIAGGVALMPLTAAAFGVSCAHYLSTAKQLEKIDGLSMTQKRKSGLYPTLYHSV